jgi:hypothetical protein
MLLLVWKRVSIYFLKKEINKIPGEEEYERAIYLINSGYLKESIPLFHKSANLNYPPSFLWLYSLAEDKNEEQKWKTKAETNFTWYQSKAQDGKPDSLFNLGLCFHYEVGTIIDLKRAAELYVKLQNKDLSQLNTVLDIVITMEKEFLKILKGQ